MKKLFATLTTLLTIISLSGCFEEKNEYYLNPNGSGKVIREVVTVGNSGINFSGDNTDPDPATQLKELTQEIFQNARGIETWSDVTANITNDGKLHFKGTAYFKDITKVSFNQESFSADSSIIFSRNGGLLTMELKDDEDEETPPPPANLTADQITQQIKQERLKYNQSKPLMESILANLKQTTIVHYKGQVKQAVNFQQGPDVVSLAFEGKQLMEYMDGIMTDNKKIEKMIRAGKSMDDSDFEGFFEYLGGKPEKPRAVIALTKPLFDYKKEVKKAKADFPAMKKSLNLTAAATIETKTVEYVSGMDVQNLRVGGVRIIFFEDKSIDYRPFYQSPGYSLSLVGKLPAANMQINDGLLTKAVTLSGKDLMPKREFDRDLDQLELADDGNSISFSLKLQVPDENEKGMAEIAGTLKCFKSKGTKKTDLGVMELKEGAANKAEGISIAKAGKADWGDDYEIELKLKVLKHALKDIQLFAEDGTQIETDVSGGMSSSGFWLQRSIRTEKPLPAKGRIVLELYDGLEEYEIPFSLKNISLTGKPLK